MKPPTPIVDDYAAIAQGMAKISERPWPDNMKIMVKTPSECSKEDINTFCDLVAASGEVQIDGLRSRIRGARTLVFLRKDDATVGTVAIKCPNEDYRDDVFAKAGVPDPDNYPVELGWLVVLPDYRGHGYAEKMLRAALATVAAQDKVFATAAADNKTVQRNNQSVGLLLVGQPYKGTSGRDIVLYVN